MKTKFFTVIVLLALFCSGPASGQYSRPDIFKVYEITWYGCDFSLIRLIGREGFIDPVAIKEIYFNEINNLVRYEPKKYDLKKTFSKQYVEIDLALVRERAKLVDVDQMVLETGEVYKFDEATVQAVISEYDLAGKEGIGVVFIMESFNKAQDMGYMWVAFFDVVNGNVLLTEKMSGKAGGFGWRNYWAKTVYNVLKQIESKRYKAWMKSF